MSATEVTGIPEVDAILENVDKDFSIFPNVLIQFPARHDPEEYGCVDLATAQETDENSDEFPAAELLKDTVEQWKPGDGLLCFHHLEAFLLQMGLDYLGDPPEPAENDSFVEVGPYDGDWEDDYQVEDVGRGIEGLYDEAEAFEVLHKCLLRVEEKGLKVHYHLDTEELSVVERADVEYMFPATLYDDGIIGPAMWDISYPEDSG